MRSIIAFIISLTLYSHAYLYLYNKNIISIMPGYTFLFLVFIGIISYIIYIASSRKIKFQLNSIQVTNKRIILYWFLAYSISIVFSFIFTESNEHTLRAFKTFIVLSALFLTFFLIFNTSTTLKAGIFGIILVVIGSVLINYIDFILSDETIFSKSVGRAAGLYINPNIAGLKLVTGMLISVNFIPLKYRLAFCLFVGTGVILTFSRSSTLAWLISLFCLSYMKVFNINRLITVSVSLVLISTLALLQTGQITVGKQITGSLSEDASQRIVYKKDDYSVNSRLYSAKRALDLYLKSPVFGHGLGSHIAPRTSVSPHNQYLILSVEQGTIGLLLYIYLFVIIWQTKLVIARIFTINMAIFSFFDHNVLDFPSTWLTIIMVPLILLHSRQVNYRKSSKLNKKLNIKMTHTNLPL